MIEDKSLRLEWRTAEELADNPANWRTHPEAQRAALQDALDELDWAGALLYNEAPWSLHLIDGHLRKQLAKGPMPVLIGSWTPDQEKKILATLDPIAAMADPDQAQLAFLLQEISFESDAINAMIASLIPAPPKVVKEDPGEQIDRADELRVKWGTERGQVWDIGRHRLMCGDLLVDRMEMDYVDLVLTDPPYGVGVDYGEFEDSTENVVGLIASMMPILLDFPRVLLTPGHRCLWDYPRPTWMLGWVHPAGNGTNPWGFTCLNPVLAYGKDPYLVAGKGSRADTLVMASDRKGVEGHPAIKPLEVWKWLLERGSANEGERVYDPFLGSGTTMVAAEQLNRICYGMEIEPKYVAVALERMAGMGLEPKLEKK